jgi:GntR family transcriptional regulator
VRLVVSTRSSVPLYEQLKQQVKEQILAGELKADDLLPSVRQLARDLRVSVITTTRAYRDLEEEGFVVNVQGKGCYALPQDGRPAEPAPAEHLEKALRDAVRAARAQGLGRQDLARALEAIWRKEGQ